MSNWRSWFETLATLVILAGIAAVFSSNFAELIAIFALYTSINNRGRLRREQ